MKRLMLLLGTVGLLTLLGAGCNSGDKDDSAYYERHDMRGADAEGRYGYDRERVYDKEDMEDN